jgi:hypothetical protein
MMTTAHLLLAPDVIRSRSAGQVAVANRKPFGETLSIAISRIAIVQQVA